MGTLPISASSSDFQESYESNHAFDVAFNVFFEGNNTNGINLNELNICKAESTNYINSLKEHHKESLNPKDVKAVALNILTQFIFNGNETDIEFMCIKLLSLCHFLHVQHETETQYLEYSRFVFHFIASIILSFDALHAFESKFEFCIDTYFGAKIKKNLIRKCMDFKVTINGKNQVKLYNKKYILIQNELLSFVDYIEGINILIADYVEYKYFKFIHKMSILFVECIHWLNFIFTSNCDRWSRIIFPEVKRYQLTNIMGEYHNEFEFEMEKINAYTIMFIHQYLPEMDICPLRRNALNGFVVFSARFANTSYIARNPKQFMDLVSHFCNESTKAIAIFLEYFIIMQHTCPLMLFITDEVEVLDFIFTEMLIKYKVLQSKGGGCAGHLMHIFLSNLANTPKYHGMNYDGRLSSNIFKIVYPKYIDDNVIRSVINCCRFAKAKPRWIRMARVITALPGFTAINLFHEFMEKLKLFI